MFWKLREVARCIFGIIKSLCGCARCENWNYSLWVINFHTEIDFYLSNDNLFGGYILCSIPECNWTGVCWFTILGREGLPATIICIVFMLDKITLYFNTLLKTAHTITARCRSVWNNNNRNLYGFCLRKKCSLWKKGCTGPNHLFMVSRRRQKRKFQFLKYLSPLFWIAKKFAMQKCARVIRWNSQFKSAALPEFLN